MAFKIYHINSLYQIGAVQERHRDLRGQRPQGAGTKTETRDRVNLSDEARQKQSGNKGGEELSAEEKQQVAELKKRDAEVKAHEQAHMAAGGGLVMGGASYQYETGPDGKRYAVGGEVSIDVSPERTPDATIRKMQQVKRAALAPAQPSGTDRAVAARAAQTEAKARGEKSRQPQDESRNGDEQASPAASPAEKPSDGIPESQPGGTHAADTEHASGQSLQKNRARRVNLFG